MTRQENKLHAEMMTGGSKVAIENLHCVRQSSGDIAVIWAWDPGPEQATIVVTRLLDGNEIARKKVGRAAYQRAVDSAMHGPLIEADTVPVKVTVSDGCDSSTVELIDKGSRYIVEWCYVSKKRYKKTFLKGPKLIGVDTRLQIKFPYKERVPSDLFYYSMPLKGQAPCTEDPIGYLPGIKFGMNTFGIIPDHGREPILCGNPKHQDIIKLFELHQRPDLELSETL